MDSLAEGNARYKTKQKNHPHPKTHINTVFLKYICSSAHIMIFLKMKKTLSLLLLTGISIACYAQKVQLQLNLKQDSTYYLNSSSTMNVTETIQGQQQAISIIISGKVAHKVTAIKDTVYEMAVQYESIAMHMDMSKAGVVVDVNTDEGKQDLMSKVMSGMLHKPIKLTLSRTGKVIAIKNIDTLYSGMFANFSEVPEAQKAQIKAQVEKSFGEKAFKGNFQDAFAVFPAVAVGLNDKWATNTSLESVVMVTIKTTYVLQSITDKAYIIHGDAAIVSAGSGQYTQFQGMPMRFINSTGTATTDIKLDRATGWVTESKTTKTIKGDIEILDNPKVPGGLTFPIAVNADIAISSK